MIHNNRYKIIYIHRKLLFPHGTIQVHAKPSPKVELKVGDTVLVYSFRLFISPLFYRKRMVTVAKVLKEVSSTGIPMMELKGLGRARLKSRNDFHFGAYERIPRHNIDNEELLAEKIRKKAQEFVFLIDIPESDRLIYLMTFITQLNELIDFISHYFITHTRKKWKLYTELNLQKKAEYLIAILETLVTDVNRKLEEKVEEKNKRN